MFLWQGVAKDCRYGHVGITGVRILEVATEDGHCLLDMEDKCKRQNCPFICGGKEAAKKTPSATQKRAKEWPTSNGAEKPDGSAKAYPIQYRGGWRGERTTRGNANAFVMKTVEL